ncbi:hypothetical protein ACJX0J_029160 [Zea mays]
MALIIYIILASQDKNLQSLLLQKYNFHTSLIFQVFEFIVVVAATAAAVVICYFYKLLITFINIIYVNIFIQTPRYLVKLQKGYEDQYTKRCPIKNATRLYVPVIC